MEFFENSMNFNLTGVETWMWDNRRGEVNKELTSKEVQLFKSLNTILMSII